MAEALAEFRGETLILGIQSLSPEVATALAKSQAAKHLSKPPGSISPGVTEISPEAAAALAKIPGVLRIQSRE